MSRDARGHLLTLVCMLTLPLWPAPVSGGDKDAKAVSDDWCGFSLRIGEPWQRAPLKGYTTPGAIRCAWSGPNQSSVVICLQEPGSAVSPRVILDASVASLTKDLGATVSVQEVKAIVGMQAMWLVVTGKGTGGAIDAEGNVDTTQHWVAIPRDRDVLVLLLTCPTADYADLQKSFAAAVGSLKVSGSQSAEQKAAK